MPEHEIKIEINNLQEHFICDKVAKQASGAVLYRQNKAVLIAAVAVDGEPVEEDFLPLTVQYIEKAYAAAKIPGGFIKRETKPGDFETLTSRIVDRALRPLFPEGFRYPVTVSVMLVSSDEEVDLQVAALHAASAALYLSDLPISRMAAAVRLGKIGDEIVINPTQSELDESTLDILVAGSGKDVLMIEMRAIATEVIDDIEVEMIDPMLETAPIVLEHQDVNALDPETLVETIAIANEAIEKASGVYAVELEPYCKETGAYALVAEKEDDEVYRFVKSHFDREVDKAVRMMAKSERADALERLYREVIDAYGEKEVSRIAIRKALERYKKEKVRRMILDEGIRPDGRAYDEIRPITIETNLLPSVHGSCLFTRGETQVLATVTLGDKKDAQLFERITDRHTRSETFMVHYNFPGFAVGEATYVGAPSRRELGHGNLAKRALEPVMPIAHEGTVRVVSEVLESNGSSSMATVCAGALALRSAEIALMDLVAGIAMGLVKEGEKYAILSDITGLEDHDGDLDFKIAGTLHGITAMQMDNKLGGIDVKILKEAVTQASEGIASIIEKMREAESKIIRSEALPVTELFHVNPSKIGEIIGKAGATIRDIIERFEVSIDLDREKGAVKVSGTDEEKVHAAKAHIRKIAEAPGHKQLHYTIGETYRGKVKKIVDFGVFVEMPDGYDALLHISKVAKERVDNLHERFKEGEEIDVVVLEQNGKKVELATPEYLS